MQERYGNEKVRKMMEEKTVVLLASHGGTNVEQIVLQTRGLKLPIKFVCGCNNPPSKAEVYDRMKNLGVEMHRVPSKNEFAAVYELLDCYKPDLVAMGGYLPQLPPGIVNNYYAVNVHPAVLPDMYKASYHTYEDALNSGDLYTGITIHRANEKYDEGDILSQIIFEIPESVRASATRKGDLDMLKAIGLRHEYAIFTRTIHSLLESGNKPALMRLDMAAVAKQAQENLKTNNLPEVRTFIPGEGRLRFTEFDPKQSYWQRKGQAVRCG